MILLKSSLAMNKKTATNSNQKIPQHLFVDTIY